MRFRFSEVDSSLGILETLAAIGLGVSVVVLPLILKAVDSPDTPAAGEVFREQHRGKIRRGAIPFAREGLRKRMYP